jgi:hypothetical protein
MATPGNYWWRHLLYCGISVCIQQGLPPTLAEPLHVSTTTVVKESFWLETGRFLRSRSQVILCLDCRLTSYNGCRLR